MCRSLFYDVWRVQGAGPGKCMSEHPPPLFSLFCFMEKAGRIQKEASRTQSLSEAPPHSFQMIHCAGSAHITASAHTDRQQRAQHYDSADYQYYINWLILDNTMTSVESREAAGLPRKKRVSLMSRFFISKKKSRRLSPHAPANSPSVDRSELDVLKDMRPDQGGRHKV